MTDQPVDELPKLPTRVVLDTNILVAAGFNPKSHSGLIIEVIRNGEVDLIWDQATYRESRRIISRIPPLDWGDFEELFQPETEFVGDTNPQGFHWIPDADDRKFAALATIADADLISNDAHLLAPDSGELRVFTPAQWLAHNSRDR